MKTNWQIAQRPIILRTSLNSNEFEFTSLSSESLVSTVSSNVFKGSTERGIHQRSSDKNRFNNQHKKSNSKNWNGNWCSRDSLTPGTVFDSMLSCRKSHSMINIKGPRTRTPSPRTSLTPLMASALARSERSSLITAEAKNLYSFHWRRRSTSFLQPRWAARKFRSDQSEEDLIWPYHTFSEIKTHIRI